MNKFQKRQDLEIFYQDNMKLLVDIILKDLTLYKYIINHMTYNLKHKKKK